MSPAPKRPKMRQRDPDATLELLVSCSRGGDFIIEIPASWRVTFGYVNPSQPDHRMDRGGHCLRVYEGEKLRGVWGDVTGFRDMAIPLARKVDKEVGASTWTHDSLGNFKRESEVKVEHQLIPEAFD